MLVSDSLSVLRMPCSEASVWHTAYDEILAVSLLSRKHPSVNRGRCGVGSAAEPRGHIARCGSTRCTAGANVAAEASLCLSPLIKLPARRVQVPSESPRKISSKSLTWLQCLENTGL